MAALLALNRVPTLSVCMATFNGARYLGQQIDSIISQLEPGDELLVSDDGSTDGTPDVLASYGTALRTISTARAGGVVANFSRVLAYAQGEFILLADQDDVWLPARVAAMREALAECDLVLSNALICDSELRSTGVTLFEKIRSGPGFFRNLLRTNSFVGCCLGFRRSLLDGMLPIPSIAPWHDWLIGLAACRRGRVRLIDTPLLLYRRHNANASPTGQRSANSLWRKLGLRMAILRALWICERRIERPALSDGAAR